jgi:hypothetical protein
MKTSDYLLLGGAAVGAYMIYKQFFAPNKEAAVETLQNVMQSARSPTEDEKYRNWVAGQSELITTDKGTSYFWTSEDLNKLNFAQRLLLNLGFPDDWVLE